MDIYGELYGTTYTNPSFIDSPAFFWIVFAAIAVCFAVFSSKLAESKQRNTASWFLVGLFLGPFGLTVGLMPEHNPTRKKLEELQLLSAKRAAGIIDQQEFESLKLNLLDPKSDDDFTPY